MEILEKGWYWIEQDDKNYPAFFDGQEWLFKKYNGDHKVNNSILFSCPTGCTCTTNPDGSVTVNCTGGQH